MSKSSSKMDVVLPPANYLPAWCFREFPHSYQYMKVYDVPMDGHCLFKSFQIILQSVGRMHSVEKLRRVVADPVLDEQDSLTNETIGSWVELINGAVNENDVGLINEYRHALPIKDANIPLAREDRLKLWKEMQTSMYWGEQHACRILEEQTRMRFLVIQNDRKQPSFCWYHSQDYEQETFCVLFLSGQHYSPVSVHSKFVFEWDQLPKDVREFFGRGYSQPTQST